jgi:hypothetical protein
MPGTDSREINWLLGTWGEGNRDALRGLIPLLYDELRKVARPHSRCAHSPRTLHTTALVHEAYLRLHLNSRDNFRAKHISSPCDSDPPPRNDVDEFLSIEGKLATDFLESTAAQPVEPSSRSGC